MESGSLDTFFAAYTSIFYKKREIIIRAEETPGGIFYLKNGYVRLYTVSTEGIELTFTILKPGSYFPLMWAVANIPNEYNIEALTDVELIRAPKEAVITFLRDHPDIHIEMDRKILSGLNAMLKTIEQLLFSKAYDRVVSMILGLGTYLGQKNNRGELVIPIALTHQDIASLTGLTRETTSLHINQLEKQGLINNTRQTTTITDLKRLEHLKAELRNDENIAL